MRGGGGGGGREGERGKRNERLRNELLLKPKKWVEYGGRGKMEVGRGRGRGKGVSSTFQLALPAPSRRTWIRRGFSPNPWGNFEQKTRSKVLEERGQLFRAAAMQDNGSGTGGVPWSWGREGGFPAFPVRHSTKVALGVLVWRQQGSTKLKIYFELSTTLARRASDRWNLLGDGKIY